MEPHLNRVIAAHPLCPRGRVPAVATDVPNDWHAPVDQLYSDVETVLRSDASSCRVRQVQGEVSTQRLYRWPGHGDLRRADVLLTDGRRGIGGYKGECDVFFMMSAPKRGRLSMPLVRCQSPSAKRAPTPGSGETMVAGWPRSGSRISASGCPSTERDLLDARVDPLRPPP